MADINAGKIQSFDDDGGTLTITDGANIYAILNIVPGSMEFTNAGRGIIDPASDIDRGVLPTIIRVGPEQPGTIKCTARCTVGNAAAGELIAVIETGAASGLKKGFTVDLDLHDYDGSASGKRIQAVNAVFNGPVSTSQQGNEMTIPIDMTFTKTVVITEEAAV